MKHKHADLIHAWADGAEIEQMVPSDKGGLGGWHTFDGDWEKMPDYYIYRIKPNACQCMTREEKKPVVRWLWAEVDGYISNWMYSEDEAAKNEMAIKLEWSRTEFPE